MRFDTTQCDGLVVDSPHRLLATTDSFEFVIDAPSDRELPAAQDREELDEFTRSLAKQIMGKWYADSILND